MIRLLSKIRQARIWRDREGNALIEFAILAPIVFTMLFGVLQVGIWMQNYNALRSIAADTSRYVTVEYQKSVDVENIAMAGWARDRGIEAPYLLRDASLTTDVVDADDQNIDGVVEKTLTINYTMPSFLGLIGIADIPVSISRPIYVEEE